MAESGPVQKGQYPPGENYQPYSLDGKPTVVAVVKPKVEPRFKDVPVAVECQHCHQQIVTALSYQTGGLTWLLAFGIAVAGFFCGCCLIPFCVDPAKDVIHTCPACQIMVGRYNKLEL